ncbi:Rieske (2Fe-2S) protein [Flavobacterium silvaticum]|uniref:Rieske domain-containing protein n=1 Tax=Flavobacterium silvaticum TaxID=1852020 RepID=A0A972FJR1_9FLAO|nr:hypothetical protein [Flavobacterium silvaticum]NMH27048.1 hypothetical protein [Flavobacterium silvaticum]
MRTAITLLLFSLLVSCDDSGPARNNPYIPSVAFSIEIDTNLPLYNQLQFAGNGKYIPNAGVRGIVVFYTGSGYNAFEATCPNQAISSCSTLEYDGGSSVTCPCDEAIYSLYTADSPGKEYPLYQYRVEVIGTVLRVYN